MQSNNADLESSIPSFKKRWISSKNKQFERLKICKSYKLNNATINAFPSDNYSQNKVSPIYEEISGWEENTQGISEYKDLPEKAIGYIKRLETLIECPINIISTGPERNDTIILNSLFN